VFNKDAGIDPSHTFAEILVTYKRSFIFKWSQDIFPEIEIKMIKTKGYRRDSR
jgi:hypothetical protein